MLPNGATFASKHTNLTKSVRYCGLSPKYLVKLYTIYSNKRTTSENSLFVSAHDYDFLEK